MDNSVVKNTKDHIKSHTDLLPKFRMTFRSIVHVLPTVTVFRFVRLFPRRVCVSDVPLPSAVVPLTLMGRTIDS